ncbi:trans-sialidase [Trypanosoma conorhini]|uniref:Trans-sialidase n=1 Tax=Trypanosoma conorhini TaxID=83891 RepID=A0A3R7N2R1_9TRYP|nr:trans-sialidase [Trypanosoma conorhini]RNE99116.1 trans-sialidase [Trypanosoma conorhini]
MDDALTAYFPQAAEPASGGVPRLVPPTTIVNESTVYLLLGQYVAAGPAPANGSSAPYTDLLLAKVAFDSSAKLSAQTRQIQWADTYSLWPYFPTTIYYRSIVEVVGSGGTGVVLDDGTLTFPVQARKADGTVVSLVLQSRRPEEAWELSWGTTVSGCSNPAIAEWDRKYGTLYMVTSCDEGFYRVVRSRYWGEEWVEEDVVLSRVWGTSRARRGNGVRSGFVVATIGGKKLMLLTTPVYSEGKDGKAQGRLHLWLTDRGRVYDVGPISAAEEDAAASSLFYKSDKDGELISVYERRKKTGEESYSLVSLCAWRSSWSTSSLW